MAGDGAKRNRSGAKELKTAPSTPVRQQQGVAVPIALVKLAKYKVNIRSFHPNKQFEPGGMRFEGDDRGFSLGASYFGDVRPPGSVTSRIWQRYELDLDQLHQTGDLGPRSRLEQQSNPSAPGPGWWGVLGSRETYKDKKLKPMGTLTGIPYSALGSRRYSTHEHGGQRLVACKSWYGGENHAFLGSRELKNTVGITPVPTLDVTSELYVRLERVNGYMDIVSLVYGDAFPNCEAFIEDAAGNKLFLGTHVRIGLPATHLGGGNRERLMWANALRVRVNTEGHFGDELGVFAHSLGGPPIERDRHPVLSIDEWHTRVPAPRVYGTTGAYTLRWNYPQPEAIAKRSTGDIAKGPLHLSAFSSIGAVRSQLEATWGTGQHHRTNRSGWNNAHLHRNPNEGRSPDDYDLNSDKWKKP